MKEIIINNVTYRIGKNAEDNTKLVLDSDKEWTWFHLSGLTSCHVVACVTETDKYIIKQGALLVKQFTNKYKSTKNLPVDYCKVEHLTPGSAAGSVLVNSENIKLIVI
jgi:hypothetical protein